MVSSLTFHRHLTDTTIDYNNIITVHAYTITKVQRSTFTKASFTGLSGIHGCLGSL